MGCGSSNAVSTVESVNVPTARDSMVSAKQGKDGIPNKNPDNDISLDRNNNVINVSPSTSFVNVNNSPIKPRDISASSTRTADSGISELEEQEILTENSNQDKIINVRATDRPSTPELFLEGKACQRLQSGKEKRRMELENKNSESNIQTLPPLQAGGGNWLQRPKTRGGIAFDVSLFPDTGNVKKAPANLPKLERRKKGKKLTKEELDEKMSRATERRKQHERKIVEKSQAFIAAHKNTKLAQAEKDDHDDSENFERQHESSWKDMENEIECL